MPIQIRGAQEHNLRNVDVDIPDGLTVVTGVSGSGKTSLVFDTLYHEARRRFLDVYDMGARGTRMLPARVGQVRGLGPAVAVGQNLLNRNPSSTLATACGIHPFLRVLFARFGERHCPVCGARHRTTTGDELAQALRGSVGSPVTHLWAALLRAAPGSHATLLSALSSRFGAEAVRVDGAPWSEDALDSTAPHDVDLLVGAWAERVPLDDARAAIDLTASLGASAVVLETDESQVQTLALAPVCAVCGTFLPTIEPTLFHRSCPSCSGEGCDACANVGLHPQALAVRWRGHSLPELLAQSVAEASALFPDDEDLNATTAPSARLLFEVAARLAALRRVGLGYVGLDRSAPTLSRGESQRVRLAVALTSRLEDMLHVLDEPTVGQHPADVSRLMPAFRELGGPVVYVEHDRVAAAAADHAIDLGPGAGRAGGEVTFAGSPRALWRADTTTGRHFSLQERASCPPLRKEPDRFLTVRGATLHNLQGINVTLALGRLNVISGVSGSGKSSLVQGVLEPSLRDGACVGCEGVDGPALKPTLVDQSPIGRNPRSNPATYTQLSDILRDHMAAATGLSASHFSFNRPEGTCPTCKGLGAIEVKMRYLPSTWIPCGDCAGARFRDEVLDATVGFIDRSGPEGERHLSIADVYALDVSETHRLLVAEGNLDPRSRRKAERILRALLDIGLGYLPLGQPSPSLSGGEAQRVKLAKYLGRSSLGKQFLILDEPSTGLHPADIAGLLTVLDRLVRAGATVIVVEHNTDVIRAADWVVDLGPGAGPEGGRVVYAGPVSGLLEVETSATGRALVEERGVVPRAGPEEGWHDERTCISVRGARAHNLRSVDVDIPKGALTVVTGVSGSGKSSLVADVLEVEARRRFLESLSLYERQSVREGAEAAVDEVRGLGVTLSVDTRRPSYRRRETVGTISEVSHHLAVLLSRLGMRDCPDCGRHLERVGPRGTTREEWCCPDCGFGERVPLPRQFSPRTYTAACLTCHGVGTLQQPNAEKLIRHPQRPLCDGAMYSPGFFPQGYLCKPYNGGYDMVQGLAAAYGFDPQNQPWDEMPEAARNAFLYGTEERIDIAYRNRKGKVRHSRQRFPGFYGWVRDWDVGGTYTDTVPCPDCGGARLRPQFLSVALAGENAHALDEMPLAGLDRHLHGLMEWRDAQSEDGLIEASLRAAVQRVGFLCAVGLGYLTLSRLAASLSAGEAQRVRLASLLGSGLTALTVLLDEPTRGLHPSEVYALVEALGALRDGGNTVIVVEHDADVILAADHLIDIGPGPGRHGGRVVAQGAPADVLASDSVTAAWLRGQRRPRIPKRAREPSAWLSIVGARENNLNIDALRVPLGILVGVCGVSGSGKSTLIVDTLGRALHPTTHTTSVASEPLDPGAHDAIEGAPDRVILVDQARAGMRSPAAFLRLEGRIRRLYVESEDARALGLSERELRRGCVACKGHGVLRTDLGFLPDVYAPCDVCAGTGYVAEAWQVRWRGIAFPEVWGMTVSEVLERFGEGDEALARSLTAAEDVGLGYLVLRQPSHALSGGEVQRLKIAAELARRSRPETLYILDEPTLGQHLEDVDRLVGVLQRLVGDGHTVLVVEHHPHFLATCDWLVELGPGGGPDGGRVVAEGKPGDVARGSTPIATYLARVIDGCAG